MIDDRAELGSVQSSDIGIDQEVRVTGDEVWSVDRDRVMKMD